MKTEAERIRHSRNRRECRERIAEATYNLVTAIEQIHAESFPGPGLSGLEWIVVLGRASEPETP